MCCGLTHGSSMAVQTIDCALLVVGRETDGDVAVLDMVMAIYSYYC